MKHKVKISVTNEYPKGGIVTCKKKKMKRGLFKRLLGIDSDNVTIIIPGDSVKDVTIQEVAGAGGAKNEWRKKAQHFGTKQQGMCALRLLCQVPDKQGRRDEWCLGVWHWIPRLGGSLHQEISKNQGLRWKASEHRWVEIDLFETQKETYIKNRQIEIAKKLQAELPLGPVVIK